MGMNNELCNLVDLLHSYIADYFTFRDKEGSAPALQLNMYRFHDWIPCDEDFRFVARPCLY